MRISSVCTALFSVVQYIPRYLVIPLGALCAVLGANGRCWVARSAGRSGAQLLGGRAQRARLGGQGELGRYVAPRNTEKKDGPSAHYSKSGAWLADHGLVGYQLDPSAPVRLFPSLWVCRSVEK